MANIYSAIKLICKQQSPCMVSFSTGKDSVVMLDLMMKHYRGKMKVVYFYFVLNLSYKERLLKYYEQKYNITIIRKPCWTTLRYLTGKSITQKDIMDSCRRELDTPYIASGMRKTETFARRAQLGSCNGVDEKYKWFYPIIEWKKADIDSYIKHNHLIVGKEYDDGFKHDLSTPDHDALLYIKNQYPSDYEKIIKTFPAMEAGIKKIEFFKE